MPGFLLSSRGFQAKYSGASAFTFAKPATWRATEISDVLATYESEFQKEIPKKLRVNLAQPGFELFVQGKLTLTINCQQAPYLSWAEGSVDAGLPTPDTNWILVSFRTAQPPILLMCRSTPASFALKGKPGSWQLTAEQPMSQWVRVCAPLGTQGVRTADVHELGALTSNFEHERPYWEAVPPKLVETEVTDDGLGLVVRWKFDRPGAVVPKALIYAPLGGYPLETLTPIEKLSAIDEDGALWVCSGEELKARLPIRRVPTGRFLAIGDSTTTPLATVAATDIPSVASLALECTMADRDSATSKVADDALAQFLLNTKYIEEPWTVQQLPYDKEGTGIDLVAAHALLMQAHTLSQEATSKNNALLTSLSWRRDWLTWKLWVSDATRRRRAEGLSSVAFALCPEPERRLEGAMFQAALASENGLAKFQARLGAQEEKNKLLEPMLGIRKVLFALKNKQPDDPFGLALTHATRILCDARASLQPVDGGYRLAWTPYVLGPAKMFVQCDPKCSIDAQDNLENCDWRADKEGIFVNYTPKDKGPCSIIVKGVEWPYKPALRWPEPIYTED